MGAQAEGGGGVRFEVVPDWFCNQQLVDLRAVEFATNFTLAVDWPAPSVVGAISL